MAELVLRNLKSSIYNILLSSLKDAENKLIELLNYEKIKSQLPSLYKETLNQYILFINNNLNFNLN